MTARDEGTMTDDGRFALGPRDGRSVRTVYWRAPGGWTAIGGMVDAGSLDLARALDRFADSWIGHLRRDLRRAA